jgi:hypothetical protein
LYPFECGNLRRGPGVPLRAGHAVTQGCRLVDLDDPVDGSLRLALCTQIAVPAHGRRFRPLGSLFVGLLILAALGGPALRIERVLGKRFGGRTARRGARLERWRRRDADLDAGFGTKPPRAKR